MPGTGVNASKVNLYAVVQTLIPGVEVSKANLYSVLGPPGVAVSKSNLYAVVKTYIPGVEVSKTNLYAVLQKPSFRVDGQAGLNFAPALHGAGKLFEIDGQASLVFWAVKSGANMCGTPLPGGPGGDPGEGFGGGAADIGNYVY